MKKLTSAVAAQWRRKLAASGFDDLENPAGMLSSRGAVTDAPSEAYRIRHEARAAAEEHWDAIRSAVHSYRFATRQDRRIWTLYADRQKYTDIAAQVGISFRQVRQSIERIHAAIREEARDDVNSVNPVRVSAREKVDRMVRALDVDLLVALVGGLG